ncbi:Proline dehydrogenase 1, mitochondrial [Seminavis robusta]|uniref:Proline dehydrogenase n=1 Tax=Seminavis robusta TaxID=568900 RepID=A0A9N8HAL8_9STRA|nr:Proline dehydrogenase 1, mitochondrial [Seminavis robusta]|eukprot:Sro246_g097800.1 Proline dehydrogenase 1, mitochondrial (592) ;mRNA; r:60067-61946
MLSRRAIVSISSKRGLLSPSSRVLAHAKRPLGCCHQQQQWKSTLSLDNAQNHQLHNSETKIQPKKKLPVPDFSDAKAAYETKTTMELVRAMTVFQLCRIPILVKHSEMLLGLSRKVLGATISDAMLKASLFGHFCGGENEEQMRPVLKQLQSSGIGSILDYAAEDDGSGSASNESDSADTTTTPVVETVDQVFQDAIPKARMYDYESEHQCDRHVETFKKCIRSVKNLDADGFAAIKVTALGNPKLLEKMSRALREVKNLYSKFDADQDGFISRAEFEQGYKFFFRDDVETDLDEMYEVLDPNHTGRVDFITWSMMLKPMDLPKITAKCRQIGPLSLVSPTEEEVELMEAMFNRGHELAKEASECGTRLLIDAEQYRFQPAIDNLVLDLERNYNAVDKTDKPIIYNTYQCYLKDTAERLKTDMERSERHSFHFGAKLVRGAYMEGERALAESLDYPSPIHDTIEDTHACYNDSVDFLLRQSVEAVDDRKVELMLASHNQGSIEKAIQTMDELDIDPQSSTISFAQLYGMQDMLTYNLGQNGFRAYKYVPYGEVGEVMPYLIRRANENSAIAGGAAKELWMIRTELKRRMFG